MEKMLKLYAAPAAVTDTTLAVLWDKPEWADEVMAYQITKNGVPEAMRGCTDCTVDHLDPNTTYDIAVCAMLKDGTSTSYSNVVSITTKPAPKVENILDYGAVADGVTVNTKAIQAAIDVCEPNGMVYVPEGVFCTGALFLKSDMTLFVEAGGKLLGSTDLADYPIFQYRFEGYEQICYASLINTAPGNVENRNITLAGWGSIDASGTILRAKIEALNAEKRGRAVCLRNVDGLYIKDITIRHSPAWCTHLIFCRNVSVNNLHLYSKFDELRKPYRGLHNGDGLNPDSCKHVRIFNSTIASQDDSVSIKCGVRRPDNQVKISSEDIHVTNCHFPSGFGVTCGSDMSGSIRDVLVQDCTFEDVFCVGQIKTMRGRGGVVERVTYDNCIQHNRNYRIMDGIWFRGAINIDVFYGSAEFDTETPLPVDEGTPYIRDITFKNIVVDTVGGNALYFAGLPEAPIENIHLENIIALGNRNVFVYNVKNLTQKNVQVLGRDGSVQRND